MPPGSPKGKPVPATTQIEKGHAMEIHGHGEPAHCDAKIFYEQTLPKQHSSSHKRMQRYLKHCAELGIPEYPVEWIDDLGSYHGQRLFEFRERDGARIFWFTCKGKIICTHGVMKKRRRAPKEIRRAAAIMGLHKEECHGK